MTRDIHRIVIGKEGIDQYGHVNYKQFLGLFESAQDAFMNRLGYGFDELESARRIRSVVKHYSVTIFHELREGERCQIHTKVEAGNTSLSFKQILQNDDCIGIVAEYTMIVVLVDANQMTRKVSIPSELRSALA